MNGRFGMRLVSVSLIAVLFGCGSGPPEVSVVPVRFDRLKTSYVADALVRATTASVSSRDIALIEKILVGEGDSVSKGQSVVQLRTTDLNAAIREADAAVRVAREGLAQSEQAVRSGRVAQASKVSIAQAAVREAEARLEQAKQSARPSEVRAAEHRVASLRAAMIEADRTLARMQMLYREGAVSRAALDQAEARADSARQLYEAARDDLVNLKAGPTQTDVSAAGAGVQAAKTQLAAARAGRSEVDVLLVAVEQARARVRQAQAAAERARSAVDDRDLLAPLTGRVLRIDSEPGEIATPGVALIVVVDPNSVFVEAEVGDEDAARVEIGQTVSVTSASYPGRRIPGRVRRISPAAERKEGVLSDRRVLRFEVDLSESRDLFGPGEEVDVYAESTSKLPALLVPSDCIVTAGGKNFVWKVENDSVRRLEVRLGNASFQDTEVFGELREGDSVVLKGKENLEDGSRVKVRQK